MPFAGYEDFAACVAANQDKRNPEAYCATIMRAVEKKKDGKRSQVAALIHKHYGPGPHPSGSPQTIHRGGMSVGTQPTLIPGDEHPKPRTKVSFRLSVKPDFVAGSKFGPASRDFTAEEKSAINLAVEEFESAYPGLLPESLTFAFYNASEPVAAWTWTPKIVRQGGDPSTVFVNEAFFGDISELKRGLEEFNAQAISVTGIDDPDAARTRIIFHELVHIAENHVDAKLFNPKGPSWDSFLPYYSGEWYANRIPWDSELLPSAYATESKSEYLAESLSDVWYHGDKAAPMSKLTVHQFRLLIEGKLDEARDNAWGWRNKINEILREDEDSEITEGMLLSQLGVSA